jgi:hypothetical protein
MTTPNGEPIFPRLRPDDEPRRRPSTAVIATSALALILVIILAIVLVTRNTGASKDDLAKAAQQATDQAQAAQDAKDQKAAAEKAVAAADKAATDAKTAADAVTAKAQADTTAAAAKAASDAAAAAAAAKVAADAATAHAYQYPYGYPYHSSTVWGNYQLGSEITSYVNIRSSPSSSSSSIGQIYVGQNVPIVCSVVGETVTDSLGSSSNWDYVNGGWVADEFVQTYNQIAPRC